MSDKPPMMPPGDDPRAGHEIPSMYGGRPVRLCTLCNEPLPPPTWLQRITFTVPPMHKPKGEVGQRCWEAMSRRLGVDDPGPMPT